MTEIAAQIPALFESLSGMKMSELLAKVKTIAGDATAGIQSKSRARHQSVWQHWSREI
jgi:hypothetical protein